MGWAGGWRAHARGFSSSMNMRSHATTGMEMRWKKMTMAYHAYMRLAQAASTTYGMAPGAEAEGQTGLLGVKIKMRGIAWPTRTPSNAERTTFEEKS